MDIDILNFQKVKKLNISRLRGMIKKILSALKISPKKVSFVFCDNRFIVKLNKKYFGLKNPTDVISFPIEDEPGEYLGEAVISVEEAVLAGQRQGCDWEKELILYVIHGVLHLLGYDDIKLLDRKVMNNKQVKLFTLVFPLGKNQ